MKTYVLIGLSCALTFFLPGVPHASAAISIVGSAATGGTTAGANFNLTSPTGTAAGDVLVAACAEHTNVEGITAIGDGGGHNFTSLRYGAQNSLASSDIWYRVVGASDGTTWTFTNTANAECAMMSYRGVDNSVPIDAQGTTNTSASAVTTFNAVTTITNGAWYIGVAGINLASGAITTIVSGTPATTVEANVGNGGNNGSRANSGLIDVLISNAGTTNAYVYNLSTSVQWGTDSFALRPSSTGGSTSPPRKMRLFSGFHIKFTNGRLKIQ